MKNKSGYYLLLTSVFIVSLVLTLCEDLTLNINNGEFNISYNSDCNLLNSSTVSNNIKCLMLCQMAVCKYLIYDPTTNRCILNGSQPELIEYANLTNLSIVYNLDTYLNYGQSCLFGFTCNGSLCLDGICTCMRNLTAYNYGLIDQWTLNNTLLDSVRCNDLTQYTNASFSLESSSPIIYSGKLQSNGYFSAPSDIYFSGDFTITAFVNVISTQKWARLIDFGVNKTDSVFLSLSSYLTGDPTVHVYNSTNYDAMKNASTTALVVSKWTHVAGILRGNNISIYLNCTLTNSEFITTLPRNVVRTSNYIGRSNWASDSYANAKFRNLRIYNRALSSSELLADFNYQ